MQTNLLGNKKSITEKMRELGIEFECEITNPRYDERRIGNYDLDLFANRSRKGMTIVDAQRLLKSRAYFAADGRMWRCRRLLRRSQ